MRKRCVSAAESTNAVRAEHRALTGADRRASDAAPAGSNRGRPYLRTRLSINEGCSADRRGRERRCRWQLSANSNKQFNHSLFPLRKGRAEARFLNPSVEFSRHACVDDVTYAGRNSRRQPRAAACRGVSEGRVVTSTHQTAVITAIITQAGTRSMPRINSDQTLRLDFCSD
jgi:hypothetical protein